MPDAPHHRLALSTCWNSHRHDDGYTMLAEIRELGFEQVELSHGIPVYLVEGILRALEENVIKVSSVHNFCPLPSSARHAAPNLFQPSAKRKGERDAWLRYSRQTLDFAARVDASHVIMHSGSVDFRFRSPVPVLSKRAANPDSPKQRRKAIHRLERAARRTIPHVREGYRELLPYARERSVVIGIENREGLLELPLDSEFPEFIHGFSEPCLAPWIDIGHAEIKRRLGLLDPWHLLEELSESIAGFHLHDVSGEGRDHQTIGSGTVDFRRLGSYLRPSQLLVLELSPRLTTAEVVESRRNLLDLLS